MGQQLMQPVPWPSGRVCAIDYAARNSTARTGDGEPAVKGANRPPFKSMLTRWTGVSWNASPSSSNQHG